MSRLPAAAMLAALLFASSSFAQAPPEPAAAWLATPEAHRFRDRVVALALLYGESSGIDPQGFKVEAKQAGALRRGCAEVDVVTSLQAAAVRRERLRACKDADAPIK